MSDTETQSSSTGNPISGNSFKIALSLDDIFQAETLSSQNSREPAQTPTHILFCQVSPVDLQVRAKPKWFTISTLQGQREYLYNGHALHIAVRVEESGAISMLVGRTMDEMAVVAQSHFPGVIRKSAEMGDIAASCTSGDM